MKGVGGHFYEYAVHVLEAARDAGYEPVLVANRAVKGDSGSDGFPIIPTYRHEFWDAFRPIRFMKFDSPGSKKAWRRLKLWAVRISYSGPGGHADDPRWQRGKYRPKLAKIPHAPLRLVRKLETISVGSSRLGAKMQALGARLAATRSVRRFADDTEKALRSISVKPGDIVFAPTCSEHELNGVVRLLSRRKDLQGLDWRLLFRRPLAYGHHALVGNGADGLRKSGLGQALLSAREREVLPVLKFLTDTDDLTYQHNFLGLAKFETVPIPHTTPRKRDGVERRVGAPTGKTGGRGMTRVVYMGDARTEKGYAHLPEVIAATAARGRVGSGFEFVLQSNFNIPGGEPEVVVAKARLERMQEMLASSGSRIELKNKALKSEEYWATLCSADVNLIIYDELLYGERSSGIFTESLTCGIPVVVQSGTWMAWQLQPLVMQHERSLTAEMTALRTTEVSDRLAKQIRGEGQLFGSDLCVYRERSWCWIDLPVPKGSHFVEVSFDLWKNEENQRVDASVTPMLAGRRVGTGRSRRFQVRNGSSKAFMLVPVPAEANSVRVNFRNISRGPTLTLSDLRVRSLADPRGGDRPWGWAGLICGSTEEVPDMLVNIADHPEHYRETCRQFAEGWGKVHNAPALIECLIGETQVSGAAAPRPLAEVAR